MKELLDYYIFLLIITSGGSLVLAYLTWKRRKAQGASSLSVFMMAIVIWSGFQAATLIANDFYAKAVLSSLRYIGIELAPVAFLGFAWNYANRSKTFIRNQFIRSLLLPAVFMVFLCTNSIHHLFFTRLYMDNGILVLDNGPIFWVNMIYLYFFIAFSLFLLIKAYRTSISKYKAQAAIIMIGGTAAVLANLLYNFGLLPWKYVDITPTAFSLTGLIFFYALFRFRLFEVVPIARGLLVEEMDDAFIVIDNQGRVLDMNKKARQLILSGNKNDEDYVGVNIDLVCEGWRELAAAIQDDGSEHAHIVYNNPARAQYYDLNKTKIYDKDNNVSGRIIGLRNITNLQEALQAAKEAQETAEHASKVKGEFLANMSHEIRTPMNAVLGISEMLRSDQLNQEEQKRYAQMIMDSAEALMTIINDILDLSKVEAGKLVLDIRAFNLKRLVEEAVETFKMGVSTPDLTINLHMNDEFPQSLLGDAVRFRQILINLVGNAVKFTHKGSVDIYLKLTGKTNSKCNIELVVADTGIGIPQNKLKTIFESFEQADGSTTRRYGGTGLGLSIVRSLVELMHGTISVQSQLDHGSTFTINIPMEIAAGIGEDDQTQQDTEIIDKITGLKVLVAEDNKINREIVKVNLSKLGCEFDMVENGALAVEQYEKQHYDVILMDIHMPEMDGLEATQIIRAKERLTQEHVTIIALTASAMEDDIRKCLEAGMNAHVSKPVKLDKLKAALSSVKK